MAARQILAPTVVPGRSVVADVLVVCRNFVLRADVLRLETCWRVAFYDNTVVPVPDSKKA